MEHLSSGGLAIQHDSIALIANVSRGREGEKHMPAENVFQRALCFVFSIAPHPPRHARLYVGHPRLEPE
jgi:hypothetical protein